LGAKFQPEKYDFDLFKGFFMDKKSPDLPDFKEKETSNRQIFLISFSR
jgi:hypothetical protein